MESRAEMSCVLKVNINCDTCRRKVMDVLQNLHGVYSVDIDAEKGTMKVSGNVNPNLILNIFEKYGKHGEISCVKFEGDTRDPFYHHHCNYYGGNGFIPYGSIHPYPFMQGPDPYFPWFAGHHYAPTPFPPPPPPLPPPPPPPLQPVINYFPPKAPPAVEFEPPEEMNPDRCNIM
ncbi:hypothetical protein E1A91_D05G439900v1 [Gossypium mustelinum]|uniref:HMA domain-containing protein n=1 Tax=Gossypium mustelinum TaxID=34275 RepID=A0A5D2V7U5_GOSMU|nr:hypothetical protein E1A91_D05G439900v1 [Gossypium mustelinum]